MASESARLAALQQLQAKMEGLESAFREVLQAAANVSKEDQQELAEAHDVFKAVVQKR